MEHVKFLQPIFRRLGCSYKKTSYRGQYLANYLATSDTYLVSTCYNRRNLRCTSYQVRPVVPCVTYKRFYSDESKPSRLKLMDFDMIIWPSVIKTLKNWINTSLIVRPYLDPDFSLESFLQGAKQVAEIVSEYLAQGKLEELETLLTPECLSEVKKNLSTLNTKQRHELGIKKEDIYFSFPYELGIIFDDQKADKENPMKRHVEITVVHHVLRGHSEMMERGEQIPLNMGVLPEYRDKICILNYRFIRNYTKGVSDSWTLNVVNHFKPSEHTG